MVERENNKAIQNTISNLGQGIGDGKLKQWVSNTGARRAAKKVNKDYEKHGTCYGESCAKGNFKTKGNTGLTANKKGGGENLKGLGKFIGLGLLAWGAANLGGGSNSN
ncbi:MAG: hypothetical protein DRI33_04490 [Caldiserica bacterium]|nr:MAG: hypothetical protein DRI33_04490 [Caldisericota bacterium]